MPGDDNKFEYLPGFKSAGPRLSRATTEAPKPRFLDIEADEAAAQAQALARIEIVKVPADQAKRGSKPPAVRKPKKSGVPAKVKASAPPLAPIPVPAAGGGGVIDDSGRGPMTAGILIMLLFFGVLGTWAAIAPLAGATAASGVLVVEGNRKAIQHNEGGIVRKILVHEGDKVKAGDVLVELDDNVPRTNVAIMSQQHDAQLAQVARLSAELEHSDSISFPKDLLDRASDPRVAEAINGQRRLFEARKAALAAQISGMEKRGDELREHIRGEKAQNQARSIQRQSIKGELDSLGPLVEKGIVTRSRLLELDRTVQRLDGEEQEISARIGTDLQSIQQIQRQITQIESERVTATVGELRDVQNKDADVMQRMQAALETLAQTKVRSPVDGTVLGLSVFTQGAVIGRGEKIMEIVPDGKALLVDASVRVDDIAYVHLGMHAEVRLTAFRQRNIPTIDGVVTQVSADRVTDRSGTAQYPIKVKIDDESLKDYPEVVLYPGMPVLIYIPTGNRTALDYLMSPLRDSVSAAFREH